MTKPAILCLVIFSSLWHTSSAQYEKLEEITYFSSRMDNPVKVESEMVNDEIHFFATNRSLFPYEVELSFKDIQNLTPYINQHKEYVFTGKHRILTLKIKNEGESLNYDYQARYWISNCGKEPDDEHPYLLPLAPGRAVQFYSPDHKPNTFYLNHFSLSSQDTVFCMRKGTVTAEPCMHHQSDRISKNESLEIMHADGTVMVYENLCHDSLFVKLGHKVFPGQPLGVVNNNCFVPTHLYAFKKDGIIQSSPILFVHAKERFEPFNRSLKDQLVVHPTEVVTQEMTRREIKKYKQNKLYTHSKTNHAN